MSVCPVLSLEETQHHSIAAGIWILKGTVFIFYIILPNVSQKMKQEILSIKMFNFRDKVWAVKWYRGNFEIFRFIADETPPTKVFKLDHFDVDVSKS